MMRSLFRSFFRAAAVLGIASCALAAPQAQSATTYPNGPITLIIPWDAGGAIDLTGRKLAQLLGDAGVKVIVQNQPGASSIIGLNRVARAAPNGYTLGLATPSLMGAIAENTTPLRLQDFTVLNEAGIDQLLLVVPKNSPAKTIDDFVKLMKDKPAGVSVGIPGTNNVNQIFAAALAKSVGVKYANIPYTGGSQVLVDVAGGRLDAGVVKPSESIGQIKSGMVRAIGVFTTTRVQALPDVPTFQERHVNVFSYGEMASVTFIVAPKGLPTDIRDKLETIFARAINSPAYRQFTAQYGMAVSDVRGPAMTHDAQSIQATFNKVAPALFKKP